MQRHISVVIPNYNKAAALGKCLEAAFASDYGPFDVVVVDDCSDDNSVETAGKYPCRLIRLDRRSGTSTARNTGARSSSGEILFFTDSDCLLQKDTLIRVNNAIDRLADGPSPDKGEPGCVVIGGTYTKMPFDKTFFSIFQSAFVHYSETKNLSSPDYIAAHAMVMRKAAFMKSGGFPEDFMPILEDVEFSHRLRRMGCRLAMSADIQVAHIFGLNFFSSLFNAHRKTSYWCTYSMGNKDMFEDSGSASFELKTNVASWFFSLLILTAWLLTQRPSLLYLIPAIYVINTIVNRNQLKMFYETKGLLFAVPAFIYYFFGYPLPIGIGTATGIMRYFLTGRK